MLVDRDFWRAVGAYMADPGTVTTLMLDTTSTPEVARPTGMACWYTRASKTLTYRLHDMARERGLDPTGWFIAVVPTGKWPTDISFQVLVVDEQRKHWGLHELASGLYELTLPGEETGG